MQELLQSRTPARLLDIWEREHEDAGWYTAIVLLDRMRICVENNKPLHVRAGGSLHPAVNHVGNPGLKIAMFTCTEAQMLGLENLATSLTLLTALAGSAGHEAGRSARLPALGTDRRRHERLHTAHPPHR